eukprot:1636352-Lingulodinium_polyedra.AAC.1
MSSPRSWPKRHGRSGAGPRSPTALWSAMSTLGCSIGRRPAGRRASRPRSRWSRWRTRPAKQAGGRSATSRCPRSARA